MNFSENNKVLLMGEICSEYIFSHSAYENDYYLVDVAVQRLSGYMDVLPVMVTESVVNVEKKDVGKTVLVEGAYHSFNRKTGNKKKLDLYIYALSFNVSEDLLIEKQNNQVCLNGFICQRPVYRKTPLGREITDLLIAVNRKNGKSDYIPCILWGRTARAFEMAEVGTYVQIVGRIQSRNYDKKVNEIELESRIAYEVSVNRIE